MAETPQTEAEMMAEWENMADGDGEPAAAVVGQKVLDQNEIDSLMGVDGSDDSGGSGGGITALLNTNVVNYEKLPMLDRVFDEFERFLSTSLRHLTADNVEVTITGSKSIRFGDYLNSVPLPAGMVVVNAVGLDDYVLVVYESKLVYAVVEILLGGRKAVPAPVENRSFTNIERKIVDNLTNVVLECLSQAFEPVAPIQFKAERMEVNPRFAQITRDNNAVLLVNVRVNLEEREGEMQFCMPYATLEPVRDQLLQQFMGEKFGQDNIWENHLAQELYHAKMPIRAVLDEMTVPLREVLKWRIGDTVQLTAKQNSEISLKCGSVTKMVGQMGRADDRKAIRITKNIADINNMSDD